jgi:type IV pilus assembly protein PilE
MLSDPNTVSRRPAKGPHGFTLIELVVAMVIVAILASIAIPSYSSYVRKARRVDAKTAVLDAASLEERYYSTNYSYTNSAVNLGYATAGLVTVPAAPVVSPATPLTVGSGYYQLTIPTLTAPTATTPAAYAITATALGDQLNDKSCYQFTVTSTGLRTANNQAQADTTATCW